LYDVPYLLTDGDITLYDVILDSDVYVVYDTLYMNKINTLNKQIQNINDIMDLDSK